MDVELAACAKVCSFWLARASSYLLLEVRCGAISKLVLEQDYPAQLEGTRYGY